MPIDYRKWDNITDSDDDDGGGGGGAAGRPAAAAAPHALQQPPAPDAEVLKAAIRYATDQQHKVDAAREAAREAGLPEAEREGDAAARDAVRAFRRLAEGGDGGGRVDAAAAAALLRPIAAHERWDGQREGRLLRVYCGGGSASLADLLCAADPPAEAEMWAAARGAAGGAEADCFFSGDPLVRLTQWAAAMGVERALLADPRDGDPGPLAAALRRPQWRPCVLLAEDGDSLQGHEEDGALTVLTAPDHAPKEQPGAVVTRVAGAALRALADEGHTVALSIGAPQEGGQLAWRRLPPAFITRAFSD